MTAHWDCYLEGMFMRVIEGKNSCEACLKNHISPNLF